MKLFNFIARWLPGYVHNIARHVNNRPLAQHSWTRSVIQVTFKRAVNLFVLIPLIGFVFIFSTTILSVIAMSIAAIGTKILSNGQIPGDLTTWFEWSVSILKYWAVITASAASIFTINHISSIPDYVTQIASGDWVRLIGGLTTFLFATTYIPIEQLITSIWTSSPLGYAAVWNAIKHSILFSELYALPFSCWYLLKSAPVALTTSYFNFLPDWASNILADIGGTVISGVIISSIIKYFFG